MSDVFRCRVCQEELLEKNRRGNREICKKKECQERSRMNWWLQYRYGITLEEYERILKEQGGVCAICKRAGSARSNRTRKLYSLAVDHNHQTNQVRGLLCFDCNYALGAFAESIERFNNAIDYIKRYSV